VVLWRFRTWHLSGRARCSCFSFCGPGTKRSVCAPVLLQAMSAQPPQSATEAKPRLNAKTLFVVGAINLIDCINMNMLLPYVDKMVSAYLDVSPQSPEVATTAALLIGVYSLLEVMVSPLWGMLADMVGRRPCLLVGLAGSVIAPILLGFSKSIVMAFAARALDGFFCGNMVVTKTYLGELVDEKSEARGFSLLAFCFSLGLILGPAMGGQLVYPASWAPNLFAGTIFDECPFLLPNLVFAIFAAISWCIAAFCIEETLPKSQRCKCRNIRRLGTRPQTLQRAMSGPMHEMDSGVDRCTDPGSAGGCYPLSTIQVIIMYCGLTGSVMAQDQLMVWVVSYDHTVGGFELSPRTISIIQNVGAVGVMLSQLTLYPVLTKKLGFLNTLVVGFVLSSLAYGLFPVYGLLANPQHGYWREVVLGIGQCVFTTGTTVMFPTAFAFVNRASQGLNRGAVNGWAHSSGALCEAVFPYLASVLLGYCNRMGSLGRYIPFYAVIFMYGLSIAFSWTGLRYIDQRTPLSDKADEDGSCV